jgi:hypothetical protein
MASAAVAVNEKKRELVSLGWMISQKDDLIWFIGSVLSSYVLLFANLKFGVGLSILVWIWALGFDGPHVFATISRTYADRDEMQRRRKLFLGSLLWFLLGPTLVVLGWLNFLGTSLWGPAFFVFASLWAYYHLVKQHYGFMILYKKKNQDLAEFDNLIDRAFLFLGMTYPLLHFIQHGIAGQQRLPFAKDSLTFSWFTSIVLFGFLVSAILFVVRQAQRLYQRQPINLPKLLLLAACLPVHWIVIRLLEPVEHGDIALVAMLTIYHNIQYHRIVWFHNRNKYKPENNFGVASFISKNLWRYAVLAFLFGAFYHIPNRAEWFTPGGIGAAFIWGGAFIHYYLDSKIWRVRSDKKLNENLKMAEPASA